MKITLAYRFARAGRRIAEDFRLHCYNIDLKRRLAEPNRSRARAEALERASWFCGGMTEHNLLMRGDTYASWLFSVREVKARRNAIAYAAEQYKTKGKFGSKERLAA